MRNVAWWFASIALLLAPAGAGAEPALRIDVAAREIAAGEPLRVVVRSSEPLSALEGRFLDESFPLEPGPVGGDGVAPWTGWTMVDLSRAAGPASLELQGRTAHGAPVSARRTLDIADKSFPSEQLSVEPSYVEPPPEVRRRLDRERELLASLYRARGPLAAERGPFVRPVPGERTSVFGTRRVFNGRPRDPHPGLDLRAAAGSPVRAAGTGRVVLARELYYSGNTILLDHGGGLFTIYAHLSEFRVAEGQDVAAGAVIALSGATGRVTGPHLHWGAKIGDRPFDPSALLDPALWSLPR